MIPKTIHYCWFGRGEKPKLAEKCIRSWKKYCPDYQLIEWNEDNFDLSAAPLYVRQAYEAGKWAFVTDYVRLHALTGQGGIYMDTDVELVKPLDPFLRHEAFMGFESEGSISTGVMACQAGFALFREFLTHYDERPFYREDGTCDVTTNVETVTAICQEHGLRLNGAQQTVAGLRLYPRDVFSPVDFETGKLRKTRRTAAIHWFSGSWYTNEEKLHRQALRKDARRDRLLAPLKRLAYGVLGDEGWERWQERLTRYRMEGQLRKLPRRLIRKLLGKPNEDQ